MDFEIILEYYILYWRYFDIKTYLRIYILIDFGIEKQIIIDDLGIKIVFRIDIYIYFWFIF